MGEPNKLPPSYVRLQEVLQNEVHEFGSYSALQDELAIDRRKLKHLAESSDDTRLTFSELHTLDTFLRRKGHGGLSQIFRATDLLQAIADLPKVTFLIGFKPEASESGARTWISHWDLRSVKTLLEALYRYKSSQRLHVNLEEVPLSKAPSLETLKSAGWFKSTQIEESGQSLIAIGSPKACHASEILLSKMFDVPPFQEAGTAVRTDLPFQFEWTKEQLQDTPSSFAYSREPPRSVPSEFERFTSFSLRFVNKVFEVAFEKDKWDDYGVIVVQRRANGSFFVVCAGLSGPATFAAARVLATGQLALPQFQNDPSNLKPIVHVVKAAVRRGDTQSAGDRREVDYEQLIVDADSVMSAD